jgi:hypothetical protein
MTILTGPLDLVLMKQQCSTFFAILKGRVANNPPPAAAQPLTPQQAYEQACQEESARNVDDDCLDVREVLSWT